MPHLAAQALPTHTHFFQKGPGTSNTKAVNNDDSDNESEHSRFRTENKIWEDETYTAKTMMCVDPDMVNVLSGKLRNKAKCELEIDLDTYCNTHFEATDNEASEIEVEGEENENVFELTSLNSVFGEPPNVCRDKN